MWREYLEVQNKSTRRDVLLGFGGVAAGMLGGATLASAPAQAGVGWGFGPKSGLPFWLGGFFDLDSLDAMMPIGRKLDVVTEFEGEGTYTAVAVKNASQWKSRKWHKRLVAGQASALHWTSSPFCSGSTMVTPTYWPSSAADVTANYHLNASVPPTYTGLETPEERTAKQRRVWQILADGWLDPVWREKMLILKRDYFIKYNLTGIRIILRVAHEFNSATRWGVGDYRRAYGMMALTGVGDYQLVQEAFRRYNAVFLDVFGNIQAGIVGDYGYTDSQLHPYWNPVKNHNGPVDVRLTCPSNAKLVGPDNYNFNPAALTDPEFQASLQTRSKAGWPIGIATWLEWARQIGKPFAMGEVGLKSKRVNPDGSRPATDGWDNPVFIKGVLDFCKANAADIGFISFFNNDNSSSPDFPASLMTPWPDIDNVGISCVRLPPGDNNRCGARAFKQWMYAQP
jgi:hypothetical protein